MASSNIQQLFSIIKPEQVVSFLAKRGWHCASGEERIELASPPDVDGEVKRLVLPAKVTHPRFRSLIPNVVFSLAVMEGKEALDIANAMADEKLEEKKATVVSNSQPVTTGQEITQQNPLANNRDKVWTLEIENSSSEMLNIEDKAIGSIIALMSGEVLRLRGQPNTSVKLNLAHDCSIEYPSRESPLLLLGMPCSTTTADGTTWVVTLTQLLGQIDKLASGSRANQPTSTPDEEMENGIEQQVARFGYLVGPTIPVADVSLLRQASALLLVSVYNRVRTELSAELLLEKLLHLARFLMSLGGLGMMTQANVAEALLSTLERDQKAAPSLTLEWLKRSFKSAD